LETQWEQEKDLLDQLKEKKKDLEQLKFQDEEAERIADFNKVAEIRYSEIPAMEKEISQLQLQLKNLPNRLLQEEVDENLIAHIVAKWTQIPVQKCLRVKLKAASLRGRFKSARCWTTQCDKSGKRSYSMLKSRSSRSRSPYWSFPLYGSYRSWENRTCKSACRILI